MKKYVSIMLVLALLFGTVMVVNANQEYTLPQVDAFRDAVFVTMEDGSLWRYDRGGETYSQLINNVIYTSGDAPGFKIYAIQTDGTLIYQNILYDENTKSMSNIKCAKSGDRVGNANFALTKDGRLLSWGGNDNAYLGLFGNGTTEGTEEPYEILNDVKCFDVCATGGVAVKNDGTVWYWGGGYYDDNEYTYLAPVQHRFFIENKAVKACISDNNMLVLNENGELSSLIPYQENGERKLMFKNLERKKVIDMDLDNGVSWCLYDDGTCSIYTWDERNVGYSTYTGPLSKKDENSGRFYIEDVKSVSIQSNDAGYNYVAILKNDNTLWISATLSYNQKLKGIEYIHEPVGDSSIFVKILDNVKAMSTSSGAFGAALTTNNELYLWEADYLLGSIDSQHIENKIWLRKVYPHSDDISVVLNGIPVVFDQLPIIENGRTLVPLRAIFEAFGAEVNWDGNTQTVTAKLWEDEISLQIDSSQMSVNGEIKTLDVPAKLMNGRTLVPVRAISEAFGCKVDWDENMKMVVIAW